MKKPKSMPIFDNKDFPISFVRQSMIHGTGADLEELAEKPIIAVANSHTELNPGHMHLRQLADRVKEGVHAAGGIPFEFNVPAPERVYSGRAERTFRLYEKIYQER